ncbi:hypothetical protein K443DRAFT_320912 [Laccaria amethystina LaAM-08-1]|uniref:Uncharacterized protein n=1 Tax=Laccaria amethystina LaAM-08-1 TaxID=1095629 RepID=A0A0C9XD77_9AGAR|nr:hypothetical protein K443DRAFT_320912 [Laccaria amethystina LaAM-08-1]
MFYSQQHPLDSTFGAQGVFQANTASAMSIPISCPRGFKTGSSLSIDVTKLPFSMFLRANSTTSGHALAHSKTSTVYPTNLQFVFRLLGQFTLITRVIPG